MTAPRRLSVPGIVFRVSIALFIVGCASPSGILTRLDRLEAQGRYDQAAGLVEQSKMSSYGEKNALLYHLDRGILLQLAGDYADSNASFEDAKRLAQDLYTRSVTNEASTFLVSDNMRPYRAEDFERAQIPLLCALNYLMLGKDEDSLVETRQVDSFLTKLKTDLGYKNVYTEDAFARYLAGLIQEDEGEVNDAHISFMQALAAYDTYKKNYGVAAPPDLVEDALRTARKLGFSDRIEEIKKRWGGDVPAPRPAGTGELVLLHYEGLAPHKVDFFFEISVVKGLPFVSVQRPVGEDAQKVEQANSILRSVAMDQMVRVAFPTFVPTPYGIRGLTVRAEDAAGESAAAVAQDIGAIAEKNLKDRMLRDRGKAIARALIKWALTQKVADKVGEKKGQGAAWLVKTLMQTASTATEVSDKRSWGTLPDKIAVARLTLPAGEHPIRMSFQNAGGAEVLARVEPVTVRAGRRTFIIVRTAQ